MRREVAGGDGGMSAEVIEEDARGRGAGGEGEDEEATYPAHGLLVRAVGELLLELLEHLLHVQVVCAGLALLLGAWSE
jgi:hypothetical protein